jgi:hypothetical protein
MNVFKKCVILFINQHCRYDPSPYRSSVRYITPHEVIIFTPEREILPVFVMQIKIRSILGLPRILNTDFSDVPLLIMCTLFKNYSFWLKHILLWLMLDNLEPIQESEYSGRVTYQILQMC